MTHTQPAGNLDRFSGFAHIYDRYRPEPPPIIADILCQMARVERPSLVLDIGCGTGLSTLLWAGRADAVIGSDPNADMLREAEARHARSGATGGIRFVQGVSSEINVPDGVADIVTASQSLHWMEPESTFTEVARVLRPGGVFAAYDCDWPPTIDPDVEIAYDGVMERVSVLSAATEQERGVRRWGKSGHLERMWTSGRFRYVKESAVDHVEDGNAERLVGLALSQGSVQALLQDGMTEEALGLDGLRDVCEAVLGARALPWYWTYRIRLGVK